jgi:hypothetical protein
MRYPNKDDKDEVCCYECSDYMLPEFAIRRGDAFFCVFCLIDDQEYRIANGEHVEPLPPKARRILKAHADRVAAALKYPIGASR